jgi:peptidase E
MADVRRIFAMGGGGFTMEPENPALDEHILALTGRTEPRLLFLPTASGDAERQVARFHHTYDDRPCHASVLSLFRLGETGGVSLRDLVLAQDVVYVGGGSMRSLLAIWREYGLDLILREAWERGVLLAGLSAGAMCWFSGGVTMSTGVPAPVRGLGLLPWSLSVHADGDPGRLPVFEDAVATGFLPPGWAADDGVGLLFEGTELVRTVSSRPRARAVRVDPDEAGVARTPVLPSLLTAAPRHERPVAGDVLEFRRSRLTARRRGSR